MSLSQLLEKVNLKYDDLNSAERSTLKRWVESVQSKQLTIEDTKVHIRSLIDGVETELADVPETTSFWNRLFHKKRDIYLKARLKNYLMLYDFLTGPERAQKWVEQQINTINLKQ